MKVGIVKFLNPKTLQVVDGWVITKVKNQFKPLSIRKEVKLDNGTFYNLGLWSGDKYVFGGSVGLTNTSEELIDSFHTFLKSLIKESNRIRKILINNGEAKRTYANSWLLLNLFNKLDGSIENFIGRENQMLAYFSGKIDADGTIMPQNFYYKTGLVKITYNKKTEALRDQKLFQKFGYNSSIIPYKGRNAFDLKLTFLSSLKLIPKIKLKHIEKQAKIMVLRGLSGR